MEEETEEGERYIDQSCAAYWDNKDDKKEQRRDKVDIKARDVPAFVLNTPTTWAEGRREKGEGRREKEEGRNHNNCRNTWDVEALLLFERGREK